MRYIGYVLAITCVCVVAVAYGQEADPIETDRDSFTPATTTVGAGRLVLESGYSFIDNLGAAETHSFPELLGRYGVCDWLELRFGSNYEVGGESSAVSGSGGEIGDLEGGGIETEAQVSYGLKAALTEQNGWTPRSSAIVQASTPTSGNETATHVVATYVWGWTLTEGVVWDSAIRYGDGSAEEDGFNRWAPSTVLKAEVAENVNAHIEYFGVYTEGRGDELTQSYVSPGVHYLVNPNLEVGVRVGWGMGADAANFFSNVGVGVRF